MSPEPKENPMDPHIINTRIVRVNDDRYKTDVTFERVEWWVDDPDDPEGVIDGKQAGVGDMNPTNEKFTITFPNSVERYGLDGRLLFDVGALWTFSMTQQPRA